MYSYEHSHAHIFSLDLKCQWNIGQDVFVSYCVISYVWDKSFYFRYANVAASMHVFMYISRNVWKSWTCHSGGYEIHLHVISAIV